MLLGEKTKDLSGYILIAYKKIRPVVNIELLNYISENRLDTDIEFYKSLLPDKIYDKELDFNRIQRIRKIAPHYIKYSTYYTLERYGIETLLKHAIVERNSDNLRYFDYVFLWESENLVTEYKGFCFDLQKLDSPKMNLPCYCRLSSFQALMQEYEEYGELLVSPPSSLL